MIDKEKLKEIKKLADAMYYAAFNLTTDASLLRKAMKEYHQFIIHEYCKEEPVAPKVLEDMLNAKTAAESLGISQEEHDRIVDELIYGKEPEYLDDFLALEEIPPKFPLISQKKCMYTKDDFTDEDRKVLCDGCEEECELNKEEPVSKDFELALAEMVDKAQKCVVEPLVVAAQWKDYLIELSKSEEPVSEELEEEIDNYVKRNGYDGLDSIEEIKYIANHFANWQKQQDQETIELAEDHAMLAGMEKMKEQMMAKAVDGDITFDYYGDGDKTYGCIAHNSFCLEDFGLKDRDKVKMILIKED